MKHLIRIVVIILLTSAHTYAQQSSINWTDIETNIRRRWLLQEVQEKLLSLDFVTDVELKLVWEPAWNKSRMSDEARMALDMY